MIEAKPKHGVWKKGLIALLAIAVVGGGVYAGITLTTKKKYDSFNVYAKNTKGVGEMKQTITTEEDKYHLAVYYPEFNMKALDQVVTTYVKENAIKNYTSKEMYFLNIDYDVEKIYDSYIVLTFHRTIKNENNNVLEKKTTRYNFDTKQNTIMRVQDVLRRDYLNMMQKLAKKVGVAKDKVTYKNLNDFTIQKDKVSFEIDGNVVDVVYRDHKEYIALTNKNIPSLYQKDPIVVKKHKVDPDKPMVAVTFDDGPHGQNTEIIMNEFEKYDGRATFFMLGQNIGYYPEIVKDVYARGFELGNHSWDHSMRIAANNYDLMNKEEVAQEVYKTQDALFQAAGKEAKYFRPPYGAIKKNLREVSTMNFALWNIDTLDWQNHNPDIITDIINRNVQDGSVILIHDIHDTSMQAVKQFLPELHNQGYQLVTFDELMKYRGEEMLINNDALQVVEQNK